MRRSVHAAARVVLLGSLAAAVICAGQYKNFSSSIYTRVQEVRKMADPHYLDSNWTIISQQMKVDKIYLELTRNREVADEKTIEPIKKFFEGKGVTVAAGLGLTVNEPNRFQSFDYADPADRAFVKKVSELAARHFNEIILDDFFFFNTKSDLDIAKKGTRSWTQFRLETMRDVSENLIIRPAKAVNPKVKVIIKFPNWYPHFQGLGYDLAVEPRLFDGVYTGTESREPDNNAQHIQQYESYDFVRYLENIKPGANGGGWVDTGGSRNYVDRFAEQLWDTLFAKARQIMFFDFRQAVMPMPENGGEGRSEWAGLPTSFNWTEMLNSAPNAAELTYARAAGYALQQADMVLGKLGKPMGVKSYKPPNSTGEEYLHDYIGMIGVPMDIYPSFPSDAPMIFLTEAAKSDPQLVNKIKQQLRAGKSVCITSGLLRALKNKGIDDIVELEYTDRNIPVHQFSGRGYFSKPVDSGHDIVIPDIRYYTNDAWAETQAMANGTTYPMVISDKYSKGTIYVLTIPENPADLYSLPATTLTAFRNTLTRNFPVTLLNAPAKVALFAYDNNSFIVENFLPVSAEITIGVDGRWTRLHNLLSNADTTADPPKPPAPGFGYRETTAPRTGFSVTIPPHSFLALSARK